MSLRKKALLIALAMIAVMALVMNIVGRLTLLKGFEKIESQTVLQNVHRALGAFDQEVASLNAKAGDWAAWEEASLFVSGHNPEFPKKNFVDPPFLEMRVNFMLFLDANGNIIQKEYYDLERAQKAPFPAPILNAIVSDPILLRHKTPQGGVSGIIMIRERPVILTSRPIFDPSNTQSGITGTLVMGRLLGTKDIERITNLVRLPVSIHPFRKTQSIPSEAWFEPLSENRIQGFGLKRDIHGMPAFIIQVQQDRPVFRQGLLSMRYFWVGLGISSLALLILLFWLLKSQLIDQVERLVADVVTIGLSQDLTKRLPVDGEREVARLASAINMMLSGLENAKQIQESEERFRQLFFDALTANFLAKPNGDLILCNHQFASVCGFASIDEALQASLPQLFWNPSEYEGLLNRLRNERKVEFLELTFKGPHGDRRSILANFLGVFDNLEGSAQATPELKQIQGFLLDITDRKHAEEALKESEQRYRALFENTINPIFLIDEEGNYIDANQAAVQFLGIDRQELLKKGVWDMQVLDALHRKDFYPFSLESIYKTNGAERTILMNVVPIKIKGTRMFFSIGQEITERKQIEERLKYLSSHDALTGLYNRAFFEEEIEKLERSGMLKIGVIVCDLDALKVVNDNLGHKAGDLLIVEAANLIRNSFRCEDVVARVGGDEFTILLFAASSVESVRQAGLRLKNVIQTYNLNRPSIPISIAVGYCLAQGSGDCIKKALRVADERMYADKAKNRPFIQDNILPKIKALITNKTNKVSET